MTAQHGPSTETAPHIHPPKVELFDLEAMTNTDPKGVVRAVREYRVEPFGLYVARDVIGHPSIRALESWLLPEMGLRITDWFYPPGHEWDDQFYVDVVQHRRQPQVLAYRGPLPRSGAAHRPWRRRARHR